ncbi:MAG: sulfotransferase, partial [Novosphingobium sp.]
AEEQLLLALEQSKRSAHYWFALVANGSATSPKIRRMLLDAQQSSSQMDHPAVFQYALGEALDSWGEYPAAFENFSAAAARLRAERPYQRDAIEQNLQRAVRDNSAAAIGANAQNSARNDVRSIIVTGMPRSGTTLVEQILSSHSAVDDGAELGLFRILSRNAGTSDSGPLQASGQNLTTLGKYH